MADQQFKVKFVQEPDAIDYTPGSAVAAGAPVFRGAIFGVAKKAIAANALGALATQGVYDVVKKEEAFTDGQAVFWDATGNPYGGTAGSGAATGTTTSKFMGYAVGAAGATVAVVRVLQQQPVAGSIQQIDDAITDPGDAGAIPVTASGRVAIVTAGAETRTMAAPTFAGQQILLYMKTDGGNGVVTVATTVNQTGNNTLTFADVGDSILLTAVEVDADLRWRVTYNDGVALSTV